MDKVTSLEQRIAKLEQKSKERHDAIATLKLAIQEAKAVIERKH